jgi:hypothetical protein
MLSRAFRFTVTGVALAAIAAASAASSQTGSGLPSFSSIDLPKGGHVVVRRGTMPAVTFVQGSREFTRVTVRNGTLVIERCLSRCPRGYRLELEVTAPSLAGVSFANGGSIRVASGFPRVHAFTVSVNNGGTADVRSVVADRVDASISQGGRILTIPGSMMLARVSNGGAIIYWGNARVDSSTRYGGVVAKGEPGEIDRPLTEVGAYSRVH